jgi:hypothetical protein
MNWVDLPKLEIPEPSLKVQKKVSAECGLISFANKILNKKEDRPKEPGVFFSFLLVEKLKYL